MSLSKTLYPLLSTGSIQEDPPRHDWKIVDWDTKIQHKQILLDTSKFYILASLWSWAGWIEPCMSPRFLKLFSCSNQLSTKFQLLIKTKIPTLKKFLALSLSDVVFIMLINVKMPTIVGILTFMSRINFVLSWAWIKFYNLGPGWKPQRQVFSCRGPFTNLCSGLSTRWGSCSATETRLARILKIWVKYEWLWCFPGNE